MICRKASGDDHDDRWLSGQRSSLDCPTDIAGLSPRKMYPGVWSWWFHQTLHPSQCRRHGCQALQPPDPRRDRAQGRGEASHRDRLSRTRDERRCDPPPVSGGSLYYALRIWSPEVPRWLGDCVRWPSYVCCDLCGQTAGRNPVTRTQRCRDPGLAWRGLCLQDLQWYWYWVETPSKSELWGNLEIVPFYMTNRKSIKNKHKLASLIHDLERDTFMKYYWKNALFFNQYLIDFSQPQTIWKQLPNFMLSNQESLTGLWIDKEKHSLRIKLISNKQRYRAH